MRSIRSLVVIFTLSFATCSHAVLIDHGDYTTIDGLDWLDLSLTDGMTLNEALIAYSGYQVASAEQYASMWAQFDTVGDSTIFGVDASSYSNSTGLGYETFRSYNSNWAGNQFFDLFGITHSQFGSAFTSHAKGLYYNGTNYQMGGLTLWDYYQTYETDVLYTLYDYSYNYDFSIRSRYQDRGFFLVRNSVDVAEPSMVALLIAGLAGAGVARRIGRRSESVKVSI